MLAVTHGIFCSLAGINNLRLDRPLGTEVDMCQRTNVEAYTGIKRGALVRVDVGEINASFEAELCRRLRLQGTCQAYKADGEQTDLLHTNVFAHPFNKKRAAFVAALSEDQMSWLSSNGHRR